MTNDHTYWIRYKNKKYVVQKIIDGKQKQIADFPSRAQAEKYVTKHKVAAHLEKVVDKEYSFHELYLKFATEDFQDIARIASLLDFNPKDSTKVVVDTDLNLLTDVTLIIGKDFKNIIPVQNFILSQP